MEERNLKRPDFICRDRITGDEITVEITQIINHPARMKAKAHRTRIWYEIAKLVEGKLPGAYQLILPIRLDTRGTTSKRLAQEILKRSTDMSIGDTFKLGLGLELSKRDNEGSFLTYVEEEEDENEDDPVQLMTDDQVVCAIETPLQEAQEKFTAYAKGLRILLLDSHEIPFDQLDAANALNLISMDQYPSIDRIYLLNTPRYGNVLTFWKVR